MPKLIDYADVLDRLTGNGWQCLYPRSGAFGLPADRVSTSLGWLGADDPSLRPEARQLTRFVGEPVVEQLSSNFIEAWRRWLPGELWLMPKSHWAYELQFGNAAWLPKVLMQLGIDAERLVDRADGSAIAFSSNSEVAEASGLMTALLNHLEGSDFLAAFPGRSTVCTVHSHQQLWWTSADPVVIAELDAMVSPT